MSTSTKGIQRRMVDTCYAMLGTVLFSCYIVYDTQLIVGGKHKRFQFTVDDYVLAAMNLYLDILNLFLLILRETATRRNDRRRR